MRFKFGVTALLAFVFVVACFFGFRNFRENLSQPDLSITAADVLWATGHHVWKIDVSEQRDVYGFQVVAFEESGTKKRMICAIGGSQLMDTTETPVLMVSAKCDDGTVTGKLNYSGGSITFQADNLLKTKSTAVVGVPKLRGNFYYLVSDSKTFPEFEKSSNKLAIEIIRVPE